jgi:hypothetical protein
MKPILLQPALSRPSPRASHPRGTLRFITTAAAVALLATLGMSRANAATYNASNETELYAAVASANANPGLDTINLAIGRIYRTTQFLEFTGPTIVNGNGATIEGGGYNNDWGVNTSVVLNSWSGSGELALNDVTVTGVRGGAAYAIVVYERTLTLNNSSVSGNAGTGIFNFGTVTLNSSTISENTAASDFDGGGITNYSTLILNNSTVTGNTGFRGAGIMAWAGTVTLNDGSSIHHNASNYGSGIHVYNYYYGTVTVTLNDASSIHHNSSVWGGGIYNETPAFILNLNGGSNITKNTATTTGGGIYGPIGTINLNDGKIFKNAPNDFAP